MAMSEAELAEQERRAGMAAVGFDVGKVDGAALIGEIKRLRAEQAKDFQEMKGSSAELLAEIDRLRGQVMTTEARYNLELDALRKLHTETTDALRESNAGLARQLAEARAELERRSLVTFSAGDAG